MYLGKSFILLNPAHDFRTSNGRRIYAAVCSAQQSEFNDLFLPGRMAYAIDLDDDAAETDIPTTVIRSKADLQGIEVRSKLCFVFIIDLCVPFSSENVLSLLFYIFS